MIVGVDSAIKKLPSNKYFYLDNDFLGELYSDPKLFSEFIELLPSDCYVLIDPLTEFEFLRDIFVPREREIREKFIALSVFSPVASHQDLYIKIQGNALLLSKIYAQNSPGDKCSSIDLFLAARIMFYPEKAIMITGNKRHFPSCVFDNIFVLNIEEKNSGKIKAYCGVSFNKDKFQESSGRLEKLKEKIKEIKK